jgi:hypothetical protein
MLDDEEAVQQRERHRGDREEVESDNHLAVIPKGRRATACSGRRGAGRAADTARRSVPRQRNRV